MTSEIRKEFLEKARNLLKEIDHEENYLGTKKFEQDVEWVAEALQSIATPLDAEIASLRLHHDERQVGGGVNEQSYQIIIGIEPNGQLRECSNDFTFEQAEIVAEILRKKRQKLSVAMIKIPQEEFKP